MTNEKSYDASLPGNPAPSTPNQPKSETESLPSYDSSDLLKGAREILIHHQGEIYRLRLTRNGKLILNK
jgi:hemin uptake protein HemP